MTLTQHLPVQRKQRADGRSVAPIGSFAFVHDNGDGGGDGDGRGTCRAIFPDESPIAWLSSAAPTVQMRATNAGADREAADGAAAEAAATHAQAEHGIAGASGPLPFLAAIQASFGPHDISGVRAHTDAAAAHASAAMGATAYATGDHVAFAGTPDLHTAAHEAAHVVQQRAGVHLAGGIGPEADRHERHADQVADTVLRRDSAAALLDPFAGHGGGTAARAVQRQTAPHTPPARTTAPSRTFVGAPNAAAGAPHTSRELSVNVSTLTQSLPGSIRRSAVDGAALVGDPAMPTAGPAAPDADAPADQDPAVAAGAEELLGDAAGDDDATVGDVALAAAPAGALVAAKGSPGRPLPAALRARLERVAGASLEHVRVHDDAAAGAAAKALAARAFAHGADVYFAPGAYAPETAAGQELIAHEVLHTLQPESAGSEGVTRPGDPVEQEADAFAARFAAAPNAQAADDVEHSPTPTGGAPPAAALAPRTALPRFPGVVTEAFEVDKLRFIDPTNEALGKVWQEDRGYIKNSSATPLSSVIKNGKVGGGFENVTVMYVVDDKGEVWVGKRQGQNMPHPTLIGGKAPQVQAAGMVKIRDGKIVRIDNHSGHFRPPRSSLSSALKSFLKLPKAAFKNFSAESVHVDGNGAETRKAFNSLRMLKLKSFNPSKALNRIKMRYKHDPKFKGGLKGAGRAGLAIIAMLIADYFIGKWMAEMETEHIRKAIERLAPTVEAQLLQSLEAQADAFDALYDKNPDAEVYLNVVYRLAHITAYYQGGGDVASVESFAGLELKSAQVSTTPVKDGLNYGGMDACFGSTTKYHDYSMSEAVKLGDLYDDGSSVGDAKAKDETK